MSEENVQPFRWCFIGTGKLAHQVAGEITESQRRRIVSVYTRRPEAGQEFARAFGAVSYMDARHAICDPQTEGVYIVTPHNSHHEYAKLAIELGKPVLCEKPVTTDAVQAEELIRLAKEKNVYFAEAMWTWFSPVAHQVKRWLDAGEFGDIKKVIANYHMNSIAYAPRVSDPARAGGALLDIGVYPITYLYRLFGHPEEIRCEGVLKNGIDVSEDVHMTINGTVYTASASIVDFKGLEKIKITGNKGSITIPMFHMAKKAVLHRRGNGSEVFRGDGSYLNEFDCAAREIRQGLTESPLVPHQATLDVMKIMDECRRQMGLVYPFEKAGG